MVWEKLGRVYQANGESGWARSHAYLPTSTLLDDDTIRVYVAFRDAAGVGRVGYVDVDARDPTRVIDVSQTPVLDIGEPGTFDDSGVTPLSICSNGDEVRLYYAGWQLGVRVRYFLFVGLAVSRRGESFERVSRTPVLDRSDSEPLTRTGAHVRQAGDRWQMWYAGGDRWLSVGGKQVPSYELRYLESPDGVRWGPHGDICLTFATDDEYGFGRPFLIEDRGVLRMWYSIRTKSRGYRLGYAESLDGRQWDRRDDRAGIDVSPTGWDSEMVGLACVQQTRHGTYLFYNGNNFGETGFGVAVADGV